MKRFDWPYFGWNMHPAVMILLLAVGVSSEIVLITLSKYQLQRVKGLM